MKKDIFLFKHEGIFFVNASQKSSNVFYVRTFFLLVEKLFAVRRRLNSLLKKRTYALVSRCIYWYYPHNWDVRVR